MTKKIEIPSGKRSVIKLTKWFKTLDHQGFPAPSPPKLSEVHGKFSLAKPMANGPLPLRKEAQ